MLGASNGLKPADVLNMTPYELTLWLRGTAKQDHRQSVLAISVGHMTASLQRAKRMPPLKKLLPKEPLTKVERNRKVWDSISELTARGIGKVKQRKKK